MGIALCDASRNVTCRNSHMQRMISHESHETMHETRDPWWDLWVLTVECPVCARYVYKARGWRYNTIICEFLRVVRFEDDLSEDDVPRALGSS